MPCATQSNALAMISDNPLSITIVLMVFLISGKVKPSKLSNIFGCFFLQKSVVCFIILFNQLRHMKHMLFTFHNLLHHLFCFFISIMLYHNLHIMTSKAQTYPNNHKVLPTLIYALYILPTYINHLPCQYPALHLSQIQSSVLHALD